jgi:hypothetical protein
MAALRVVRKHLLTLAFIFSALGTIASAETWSVPDVDALPMDAT